MKDRFWEYMDKLLKNTTIVFDRAKGSSHPRYPHITYPLDYGYLEATMSTDREA